MHTRTRPRTLTAAALSALLLAACSDAGEPSRPPTPAIVPERTTTPDTNTTRPSPPEAAPTTEQPPPPTATTTPPEDTETTTAPPAADEELPAIPDAANENSAAGAEAYAVAYIETIGYLGAYPAVEPLEEFSVSDTCEFCQQLADDNRRRVEDGTRADRPVFDIGDVETLYDTSGASVLLDVDQLARTDYGPDGEVVAESAGASVVLGVDLIWSARGWIIADLARVE